MSVSGLYTPSTKTVLTLKKTKTVLNFPLFTVRSSIIIEHSTIGPAINEGSVGPPALCVPAKLGVFGRWHVELLRPPGGAGRSSRTPGASTCAVAIRTLPVHLVPPVGGSSGTQALCGAPPSPAARRRRGPAGSDERHGFGSPCARNWEVRRPLSGRTHGMHGGAARGRAQRIDGGGGWAPAAA